MKNIPILTLLLLILYGCSVAPNPTQSVSVSQQPKPLPTIQSLNCDIVPIKVPTLPSIIPGYAQLDESTGLHVTGTAQVIDLSSYRLKVTGLVYQPLSLTYDNLRCLPKITDSPKLVCPGFFVDTATWSGVPIYEVLQLAYPKPEAQIISLISADGYEADFKLDQAMNHENFLAYELNGQPLPVLHGFPLRAVFPGLQGSNWVKWIVEINVK